MSINIEWANNEETALTFSFSDRWTAQNLYSAVAEFCKLTEEKSHPVRAIIDLGSPVHTPKDLLALLQISFRKFPSNIERAILVSNSSYWNSIFRILDSACVISFPYEYVGNVDDAYELLEEYAL